MTAVNRDLFLLVRGQRFTGWKAIRVTRSIESLAGSFSLDVADGMENQWPIATGDAARVEVHGRTVIDGYVDKRRISGSSDSRSVGYDGRDRAGDFIDSSVLVADGASVGKGGHKWTYRNLDIAAFASALAATHGIRVSVQVGLLLQKDPILVAHPGEKCFEAANRAAGSASVLLVSDGKGGIVITRAGKERAEALVEGVNIKTYSFDDDWTDRFHEYVVTTQPPGTDEASGEALRVQASAIDADVTRTNRVLLIRPEKGYDNAGARRRADWEARIRAAKSASVTIGVQGWTQRDGTLWPLNAITRVKAPRLLGIDGDLLISQVEFTIGNEGGAVTQLRLVRPDAFTPEPQNVPVVSGEALWKEITPTKDPKKKKN